MPAMPCVASSLPHSLLTKIISSATTLSMGEPRRRMLMVT